MKIVNSIEQEQLVQSKYLYCQAAGSGSTIYNNYTEDGTVPGIHLRWMLMNELGNSHIPKGDLEQASSFGYSKLNDFVKIYKAPYNGNFINNLQLNDSATIETFDIFDPSTNFEKFREIIITSTLDSNNLISNLKDHYKIRFLDFSEYDTLVANLGGPSSSNLPGFLSSYTGIIEFELQRPIIDPITAEILKKDSLLSFHIGIDALAFQEYAELKVEFVMAEDENDRSKDVITCRKTLTPFYNEDTQQYDLNISFSEKCENIRYIRIQSSNIELYKVSFSGYQNFLDNTNLAVIDNEVVGNWEVVGESSGYGLSSDSNTNDWLVMQRLDGAFGYSIDNIWPKFKIETDPNNYSAEGKVNIQNYIDRWYDPTNPTSGLKQAVEDYIALSTWDVKAMQTLNVGENYDSSEPEKITISLLDTLKLISLDYHAARMLGLGTIDPCFASPFEEFNEDWIYAAVYETQNPLGTSGNPIQHIYMTLPTRLTDTRLPNIPQFNISYPLKFNNGIGNDTNTLTDDQGYSKYEKKRYISLNLEDSFVVKPQKINSAIPSNEDFCRCGQNDAIMLGIKYRTQGSSDWDIPELNHEEDYFDNFQPYPVNEVAPILIQPNPVFIHVEQNAGIHDYAMYAINWFSRASLLSDAVSTDETFFPERNSLLPPYNISVQYIQEEETLIFTTQDEQNELSIAKGSPPSPVEYKTRVTFDWDNAQIKNYQYADKVEFYFRENPPIIIKGTITAVVEDSQNKQSALYVSIDTNLNSSVFSKFIGSNINTLSGQFEILQLQSLSANSIIISVKNIKQSTTYQANSNSPNVIANVYILPKVGELLSFVENLSIESNWSKLAKTVSLIKHSETKITINEKDGSSHDEYVGGIYAQATVTKMITLDAQGNDIADPSYVPPISPIPEYPHTTTYKLNFATNPLPTLSDTTVSWYKGQILLPFSFVVKGVTKTGFNKFTIRSAKVNGAGLDIFIIDESSNIDTIDVGLKHVIYHPGIKLYLSAESGIFDKNKIMPIAGKNSKYTFLALRAVDTSKNIHSSLSQPVTIISQFIQEPKAPLSIGTGSPKFATRPDFYGKSTYTVDIPLDTTGRTPFGAMVYRTNEMAILQALYTKETIISIISDLAAIANDTGLSDRWSFLANVELEAIPGTGDYRFKDTYGVYHFPSPDNTAASYYEWNPITKLNELKTPFSPALTASTIFAAKDAIKKIIDLTFIPLTKTPLIFEHLQVGYQTSGKAPIIKDSLGNLLLTAASFPMATKFNNNTIRFTDYTLDGNSKSLAFYFACETSLQMKFSDRTKILGPIFMVNSTPANKPKIRKTISQPADASQGLQTSVIFTLTDYIKSEEIQKIQIYRTLDIDDALSTRTMKLVKEIPYSPQIADDFSDLSPATIPYGEKLYYRLVALRGIKNELDIIEYIPSEPSEIITATVIDTLNPEAPTLNFDKIENSPIDDYFDLLLNWIPTTYNGTYFLYMMTSSGNWELIWTIKSNSALIQFPVGGDFSSTPGNKLGNLNKIDENGNTIYYRFKVMVENASGLFNLSDKVVVVKLN